MCDDCDVPFGAIPRSTGRPSISRRSLLVGAATTAGLAWSGLPVLGGRRPAGAQPAIAPRSAWAGDQGPVGSLPVEAPGDVRVLLVHHTAGPNEYAASDVPGILQGIHRFHTGPDKGWPDVAYNFFVDRYGGVWEGRAGSLGAPVIGDATGGNQGYSQLCCFLGTHTEAPPTAEAQQAMVGLLAWLADRYDIDTAPGAMTSFVSRGSNKHPAGATVTTTTIAGHRDMSLTACPGDAAYAWVRSGLPVAVSAARSAQASAAVPPVAAPPAPAEPVTEPTEPAVSPPPTTVAPTTAATSTTTVAPTSATSAVAEEAAPVGSGGADAGGGSRLVPWVVGGAVVAAAVVGGRALRVRKSASDPSTDRARDLEG